MKHRLHLVVEPAARERVEKAAFVEIVRDLAVGEVHEFVAVREVINRNDVGHATLVQRAHDVGAYEPGRTGNDVIHVQTRAGERQARDVLMPGLRSPETVPAA